MKMRPFNRIVAAMLCFALLLPNLTGLVGAIDSDSVAPQSVQTNSKWVPVTDPFAAGEIPAYQTAGQVTPNALVTDCGNGVTRDQAKSYLKMVTGTTDLEFLAFKTAMVNAGFSITAYRNMPGSQDYNLYYRFLSPDKNYVVTAYYVAKLGEAHIVADTAEDIVKSFSAGFVYDSNTNEVAQPMMTVYGLSMSPNGYDITSGTAYATGARNCGALIVIRMPDNSLFINDGGDVQQWSDEACADFMTFCRELTGKQEGEKVVINSWFISHAHSDHYNGIPRFFAKYHDQIDLLNVMYNIDDECTGSTRDMSPVLNMVAAYFPNATYYKPHTGDHFNIAGVEFDVLYTQEDRFYPGDDGNLNYGDPAKKTRDGGTYRDYLYTDAEKKQTDFNDTSVVLRVTFPETLTGGNAVTSNLYADVNLGDTTIRDMWPAETIACDIMMVPHHGHDAHPELVALSNASIFLYTQAKSAIYGPNGIVDEDVDQNGTYRTNLVRNFIAMNNQDADGNEKADGYFETTAARKTYWEGTETACILFGENAEFMNQPSGLTRDSEDPTGFTVYTMDAPYFAYEGWSVFSCGEIGDSQLPGAETVTTNKNYRYYLVTEPKYNERYVIVHNKTNCVMMYDPVAWHAGQAEPSVSTSMPIGTMDQAAADEVDAYFGDEFTTVTDGSMHPTYIYIKNTERNDALWILKQEIAVNYGTGEKDESGALTAIINKGDPLSSTNKDKEVDTRFGGTVRYHHTQFSKGIGPDNGKYWESVKGNDYGAENASEPYQWRFLAPGNDNMFRPDATENTNIEYFDDGTCLIYYYNTTSFKTCVLTLDENGYWVRKVYTGSSADAVKTQVVNDLEDLKVRLYQYDSDSTSYNKQMLTCTGPDQFYLLKNTSADDALHNISSALTVTDVSDRGFIIECSGDTAQMGCYWINMEPYTGMTADQTECELNIYFRNDDGTDTLLGTVDVNLIEQLSIYTAYNDDDTVYAGTKYGSKYGFMYVGENVIYEEVVNHAIVMDMLVSVKHYQNGYSTTNINITPDMLVNSDGTAVDFSTPGIYPDLSLVYNGEVVDTGFTIQVSENDSTLQYPSAGSVGSVTVNKQGTTSEKNFLSTGVANIQLSANSIPEEKGVDLIVVLDLSGSMKKEVNSNSTAEDYSDTRMAVMEQSLREMIATLQGSGKDVRIAMSDFGDLDHYNFPGAATANSNFHRPYFDIDNDAGIDITFEFFNHLNFFISRNPDGTVDFNAGIYETSGKKYNMAHSQYTGIVPPTVYTGSGEIDADAFVDVNKLGENAMADIIAKLDENVDSSMGTNYDIGLEYAYRLGHAIRRENEANGQDRELVCIFLSDGAAIQYNYFAGRTASTSWRDILNGVPDEVTSVADVYKDQANWPEEIEEISQVMLELLVAEENSGSEYSMLKAPLYRNQPIESRYPEFNDRYFVYRPDLTRAKAKYFYTYMDDQGYVLYDWEFLYRIAKANGYEEHIGQEFTPEYYHSSDNVLQYLVDKLTTPRGDPIYKTDAQGNPVYKTDANGNIVYEEDENGVLQPVQVMYFQSQLENPYYRNAGNYSETDPDHADELLVAAPKYYHLSDLVIDASKSYTDQFFAAMKGIGVDCDWNLYARLAEVNKGSIQSKFGYAKPRDVLKNLIQKIKTPTGTENGVYQTLSPYAYFYNAEGKNWWAEAIKGNTDQLYPVINKYALENNPNWTNAYYGDVRNRFTTGTGLALDGQDYISGFAGLDMALYTVSFAIADDRLLTSQTAENVLKNIATGPNYFYSAASGEKLTEALNSIVSSMSASASRAWFTDTMGPDFDLSTEKTVLSHDGVWVTVNGNPTVKVMEYDLVEITDAQGNTTFVRAATPRVLETVTFEDIDGDGDVDAWSDQVYTTSEVDGVIVRNKVDIWDEETGLISAKHFYYNTNTDKSVVIPFGTQGSYTLPAESFFWVIGTLGETEVVLEYQVYLTGSIEGDRLLTSEDYYHATNTSAVLHYINYLGQSSTLDTISPKYPWGDAKLGYGYYLVNEQGQMLANRITGETTTDFSNAIRLTRPVYEYMAWNGDYTLLTGSVAANTHRPDGRTLYSPQAAYTTGLVFDGTGSWTITDTTNTTYVTLDGTAYNADRAFAAGAYANTETVVWFAVVDKSPTAAPDTVVVDYGLPVDIDVSSNDELIGEKGTLVALGKSSLNVAYSGATLTSGYSAEPYKGTYGTATIENGKVHYELTSMEMNGSEQFNYALYYTPTGAETDVYTGYYYNKVTVIPATSIYFEEDFLQYHTYKYDSGKEKYVLSDESKWTVAEDENYDSLQGAHQDEDRPGSATLPEIDADNIYGFDSAYENCSKYSLGSTMKFTANAAQGGTVTFSFYGTGFDVVSLTSSDTGFIMVDVFAAEGYVQDQSTPLKTYFVDTYYGYTYDKQNNQWVVTPGNDALYQVPVMKVDKLDYGHYTAVITFAYASIFDHKTTADASYDFYMDAVRIYNPAGDDISEDTFIGGAYEEDGEFAPSYEELRNILLSERNFYDTTEQLGDDYFPGAVFIDGIPMLNDENYDSSFKKDPPQIGTYMNYGPNNEVYLAPGQAIAFELNKPEDMKAVHMALKSTYGTAKIKIFTAGSNIADVSEMTIATATDRYYDLTELAGNTVIVVNVGGTGDGILSITNLKVTTKTEADAGVEVRQVFTISRPSAQTALESLTAKDNTSPETGDIQEELMFSLALLACLSAAAILVLTYMQKDFVKRKTMKGGAKDEKDLFKTGYHL